MSDVLQTNITFRNKENNTINTDLRLASSLFQVALTLIQKAVCAIIYRYVSKKAFLSEFGL